MDGSQPPPESRSANENNMDDAGKAVDAPQDTLRAVIPWNQEMGESREEDRCFTPQPWPCQSLVSCSSILSD